MLSACYVKLLLKEG